MNKSFCNIPYVRSFVLNNGSFRNCCATNPPIKSTENWNQWWNFNEGMKNFRLELSKDNFPKACESCKVQEHLNNKSFRIEINKQYPNISNKYPSSWSIMFGNTCNLSCWVCSETASSIIERDKRKLNLLPENFISPNILFDEKWEDTKNSILETYQHHDIVTLNLLGGEPMYNKLVFDFVMLLIENGLSKRTKLEITTNGTKSNLLKYINKDNFYHVYISVSIDATEKAAEWIRYGCSWSDIESNIELFKLQANYVELHCTLSILNIKSLPNLYDFANNKKLKLIIMPIVEPSHFDISKWDKPNRLIRKDFKDRNLENYYDLIGSSPIPGTSLSVQNYIQKFNTIRKPLIEFDKELFEFIFE
jgi:MoaA/NifB/PqqE/SkfB family radical SAM enzyme